MATGNDRTLRRWRWVLVAGLALLLVQTVVLVALLLLPQPPDSLPDPGLARPPQLSDEAPAPTVTGLTQQQSLAAFDALLEQRLVQAAQQQGVDPATLLPDAALRQAALEAGDPHSLPARELLMAWADALESLGLDGAALRRGAYQ